MFWLRAAVSNRILASMRTRLGSLLVIFISTQWRLDCNWCMVGVAVCAYHRVCLLKFALGGSCWAGNSQQFFLYIEKDKKFNHTAIMKCGHKSLIWHFTLQSLFNSNPLRRTCTVWHNYITLPWPAVIVFLYHSSWIHMTHTSQG